jgi:hypothetical protein
MMLLAPGSHLWKDARASKGKRSLHGFTVKVLFGAAVIAVVGATSYA